MDFDDEDKPKAVSRTRKFAPGKCKHKPKPEPSPQEVKPPQSDVPKAEPIVKMEIDYKVEPKEDEQEEMEKVDVVVQEEMEEEDVVVQEEMEEEDVVVREIDVFFNPSIADTKLYVLQYPLRPSWRPYEMDERCEQVRVNPSTSQVEIDFSMEADSSNYDSESTHVLKKQTLETTWMHPPTSDYALGVLSGDKLHLSLVHAVAQLRPSMRYFNKRKQTESTQESSKKQNKGVEASKDQKQVPEQEWVALKYHGLQSEYCSGHLNGMMTHGNSSIDFNLSTDAYINSLCRRGSSRNIESKDSLKRVLTSLTLEERVQKLVCDQSMQRLLCEGSPLFRYTVLKHYAPDVSDEHFLRVLQEYAVLVQGLWTPKTKLVNLDGSIDAAARDWVLYLFSKATVVKYSEVEATGRLRDKVKKMLSEFAKERPLLCDWKLKEPTDESFIKLYGEIVKKQKIAWDTVGERLKQMISQGGGGGRGRGDNLRNAVKPETPKTLSDKGGSSRGTIPRVARQKMSEDTRRALPKALKRVFQSHKVCSYETICQGLRDIAVSTSNNPKADSSMAQLVALAVDAHQEELQQFISEVAVDIHGSFVSVSSPDHPEFDPLRRVVIKLLQGSPPGTKFMKANIFEAGKSELGREITNNEYIKVMHDLCETNSSGWVLQKAR